MAKVDAHVTIERPAEVVFDYLSDLRNFPEFSSAAQETRLHGDEVGKGSQMTIVAKLLGRRFELEAEVSEYDRPARYGVRTVGDSAFPLDSDFTIESTGPASCVVHGETGMDGSGFFKIADRALTPIARRQFRHDLETMRDLLEAAG